MHCDVALVLDAPRRQDAIVEDACEALGGTYDGGTTIAGRGHAAVLPAIFGPFTRMAKPGGQAPLVVVTWAEEGRNPAQFFSSRLSS